MQQETMRGSLFPLFPLRVKCSIHPVKTWNVYSSCQDMGHQNRGGEIGTLSVFSLDEVPKPWKGPYFPYFGGPCLDKDDKAWTTKIREIGTLSWFWHFTLRGNRGNRDPLMVLEESRYVCGYVLTFFGDWSVHASDVMVAMDENMYD